MTMPHHYKELREELDLILQYFNVPKILYYQLLAMRRYFVCNIVINSEHDNEKVTRALEIIDEIMPRIKEGVSV